MILDSVMAFLVLIAAFATWGHDTNHNTAYRAWMALWVLTVSYTHLTLPTICSV